MVIIGLKQLDQKNIGNEKPLSGGPDNGSKSSLESWNDYLTRVIYPEHQKRRRGYNIISPVSEKPL
jgi:hypothetical protein